MTCGSASTPGVPVATREHSHRAAPWQFGFAGVIADETEPASPTPVFRTEGADRA